MSQGTSGSRRSSPQRGRGKWPHIPEPGPGAQYRGYLRYSEPDRKDRSGREDPRTTLAMQRHEIERYAATHGWMLVGWDEEPSTSGADELEDRPAFVRHLADAQAGRFDVSLVAMSDRWARDTAIGLESLKRLRRAGVYWATADGHWDINKVIQAGHSVAFVVASEVDASYPRIMSQKAIAARAERAEKGYHNGHPMYGYQMPAASRPEDAPYNWRPPRRVAEPHPERFARLQQIGEWAAAGLTDREIAQRATEAGWPLDNPHPTAYRQEWNRDTIAGLLTRDFPREYAPGSGHGTIRLASSELAEGLHVSAWSWDLWQRILAQRDLRRTPAAGGTGGGKRGHESRHGLTRIFSGVAVCAECGRPLYFQPLFRAGRWYAVWFCAVARALPGGSQEDPHRSWRSIRGAVLEEQFAALVLGRRLPADWRRRLVAELASDDDDEAAQKARELRRASLERERQRVLFQHRIGGLPDDELVTHLARIRQALALLPSPGAAGERRRVLISAGETLEKHRDYWEAATGSDRAAIVRTIVEPYGVRVDLAGGRTSGRIVGLRPHALLLPIVRLAVPDWPAVGNGWLIPPEVVGTALAPPPAPARDIG